MEENPKPDPGYQRQPHGQPYTAKNPIPTVQRYREEVRHRGELEAETAANQTEKRGTDEGRGAGDVSAEEFGSEGWEPVDNERSREGSVDSGVHTDTGHDDKRDQKKKVREVMDPITHLPIMIHDATSADLKQVPIPAESREKRDETADSKDRHNALQRLVDQELKRPEWTDDTREQLEYEIAALVGLGAGLAGWASIVILSNAVGMKGFWVYNLGGIVGVGCGFVAASSILHKVRKQFRPIGDETPGGSDMPVVGKDKSTPPETPMWLNSLFESIWPLVNPDLFIALADTLEDVMQASLPGVIDMVRVADLGQGNEPLRILGIKWLRQGDAGKEKDGLEAEEGDFVNLELAFAYKAQHSTRALQSKTKNAHLLIEFFLLKGAVTLPIWVELKGLVGTCRLRLQLTPDPPFFSVCTLTFLGQPKVSASCTPLTKRSPNVMNLPVISKFIQASIDAAMAEYVAPKSMTMDLKEMLMGEDFKWDTSARGVIVFHILKAEDVKQGDSKAKQAVEKAIRTVRRQTGEDGGDNYVSVSWSKLGKTLWSTRIIKGPLEPHWDERGIVLVTPEEINARESLKVQVWDSDRLTADDHIGTVEVELKELFQNPCQMQERKDRLMNEDADEEMPGYITWKVGYFPKLRVDKAASTPEQLAEVEKTKQQVVRETERKMREVDLSIPQQREEMEQQKKQDIAKAMDKLIVSRPPRPDYPSGILSLTIHNMTSLEIPPLSKDRNATSDAEEQTEGSHLPSAYCTIAINHKRVFRTRTKPKTSNPFFSAGTEVFLPDWTRSEVHVAVRDQRSHEVDPLLGIVSLDLQDLFRERCQFSQFFPIAGGIGAGRVKISGVFRVLDLKLSPELRAWDIATVRIAESITSTDLPKEFKKYKLTARTLSGVKAKLYATELNSGSAENSLAWAPKRKAAHLPLLHRLSNPITLTFHSPHSHTPTPAGCAILWPSSYPDNETLHVTLPVYPGEAVKQVYAGNKLNDYTHTEGDKKTGGILGHVTVEMKIFPGLSGYHYKIADARVRGVMEELDALNNGQDLDGEGPSEGEVSSSADSETSDEDESPRERERRERLKEDGDRGLMDEFREYKANQKGLHRRHRGIMQWKGARTVDWVVKNVKGSGGKMKEKVKAKTRGKGGDTVETEV